ncbi:MAG: hypothetical protein NZ951_03525 [Dehalococcoidia bacterium]|nr:hypothetical protein [Dehalococcoidia bacterium]MDW8119348.1 hypothetical protein [Chloroflexota bacterium]
MELPVIGSAVAHGPLVREAVWEGIVYPGEVWAVRQWEEAVARPLPRGRFFRVVFCLTPLGAYLPSSVPPGVAVCWPERPVESALYRLHRQVRVVREARARYLESLTAPNEIDAKERDVRLTMLRELSALYQRGGVWPASLEGAQVFRIPDPEGWVQALASALLQRWGEALWDGRGWSRPLRSADAPLLWEALLSPWPTAAALEVLEVFGPGLGVERGAPPQRDGVMALLREAEAPSAPDLLPLFIRWEQERGVPWWLGWIWVGALLAFGWPPRSLRLQSTRSVVLAQGRRAELSRLTPALVREVVWNEGLVEALGRLEGLGTPSAEEVVAHMGPLLEANGVSLAPLLPEEGVRALEGALTALRARLLRLERSLEEVRSVWTPTSAQQDAVALLGRVAQTDPAGVYTFLQEERLGPMRLREALREVESVETALAVVQEARHAQAFLEQAVLPPEYAEMALERQLLVIQIGDIPGLAQAPHRWAQVREAFQRFQARYRSLYREYHKEMRQRMRETGEHLRLLGTGLEALDALNSLPELGPPTEPGLRQEVEALRPRLQPCPLTEERVPVESLPYCWHCRLVLGDRSPIDEAERLEKRLQSALQERCQRLSVSAIQQALKTPGRDAVERLIQVVQLADLSPLIRVLTPQVVDLLRRILRASQG